MFFDLPVRAQGPAHFRRAPQAPLRAPLRILQRSLRPNSVRREKYSNLPKVTQLFRPRGRPQPAAARKAGGSDQGVA
eukprot:343315-Prorocentrum_minimum.AAC.2